MATYIATYNESACTTISNIGTIRNVQYSEVAFPSVTDVTFGGKTYKHFSGTLRDMTEIHASPMYASVNDRYQTDKEQYLKNGAHFAVIEKDYKNGVNGQFKIGTMYYGSQVLSTGGDTTILSGLKYVAFIVRFEYQGVSYIGFACVGNGSYSAVSIYHAFPMEFWESSRVEPYNTYSTGTDEEGGLSTGSIPGQNATDSSAPSRIIPTGGRGLHTYLINITAYGDIQGYLWGDNSTLAKSLWQKFLNKTHSPISCVLGCYSLPGVFMPSASGNTGVHLAGMYLSPIGGTCSSVDLGFVDHELTFSPLDAPFHSFADYTCIACKLHLPIVGDISIPAEFIVNRTITVRYRVDQMNGNTVARVKSDGQVIAELSGNCAYNLPITGGDDGTLDRLGALANTTLQLSAGNVAGAMAQSAAGLGAQFQTSVVNSSMNGNSTACQNGYAYIEYIYPTTNYPGQYGQVYGYACSISGVLNEFKGGYGEFEVNIDSMEIGGATLEEKEEIRNLLREGIMVC